MVWKNRTPHGIMGDIRLSEQKSYHWSAERRLFKRFTMKTDIVQRLR